MLDEEQEKILADTTILIELKDAISETYREHTARWENLHILKLEANQLSGTLPVGFGASMKSLQQLYLDHNRFEGSIDELLDLPAATTIHVHENKFFGELKDDFLDKGLDEFYFYRNYLEYSDRIANRCDGKYWKGRTEKESPMRVTKL